MYIYVPATIHILARAAVLNDLINLHPPGRPTTVSLFLSPPSLGLLLFIAKHSLIESLIMVFKFPTVVVLYLSKAQ